MRAHPANLHFPSFTRRITIELDKNVVMLLNSLPHKSGMSKTYIPHSNMTVKYLDWKKSCKLHFGEYSQVHKYRNIINMLEERTQGKICLGPTGNI